jgi:Domain of unknown function (DUF4234)
MDRIELKKRRIMVMIVLTLVTFGFYYPAWFLRRRRALNELDSPQKLAAWPFLLLLLVFAVRLAVIVLATPARPEALIGAGPAMLLDLVQLAVGILVLIQCFRIKDILEDHLADPEGALTGSVLSSQAQLSGIMTFLFTIFYLQHIINRDIVAPVMTA